MTKFFKGFGSNESSIYKIIGFLFLLSIFFLPINGFPPYFKKYLGELGAEAGNYFLLPAVLLSLVYFFPKRKFTFPSHRSWILLFLFLILFAASLFMNFNSITESSFKGRGGLEKFVVQFLLLGFEIFSVFAIYN
ncbi:MAG: hypothetical protein KAI33_08065, partial [Elusimicrobiales bacterium]|nr:hypothetical protein [Elusimicrobiales bacterium]